ncbi:MULTISPECIES: hypothetical protein [Rhizobium/Agrobacterium group]|uniref:hypothetical protein n=1 Tax=Rhizobium/Agrobacterium group TaxID=227290 RepID=UPI001115365D|nr:MULTISPECIES: hypothetical protein [Rhizobium/Agrobacterium group]NIB55393.1 hypothetical protein [Agrobacterium tumefaciens]NSZ22109.1 hypothetical protein [Agrobacterium tumefaciens]NTB18197.1 hypothetical protein [Agrobacterium tumefaciens]QQE32973.1 hypothetical protein I6I05_13720 [Agrobacterium tumefaciens]
MVVYVINQNFRSNELEALRSYSDNAYEIRAWPPHSSSVPSDASAGIYLVREESTTIEEDRVINLINGVMRIICVFVEDIENISEIAQKYCSAKVFLEGGALVEALQGNDRIQQDGSGAPASRNPQKPHNC